MIAVVIREGQLEDALLLINSISEFNNIPDAKAITRRLNDLPHLILTAYLDNQVVGCKIGYERNGNFYSWLGAVKATSRRTGIATALAVYQEQWARDRGYTLIWMKTRNCFPAMLLMACRRGFRITRIEPNPDLAQNRLFLEKAL